jgi:hypothetical protein
VPLPREPLIVTIFELLLSASSAAAGALSLSFDPLMVDGGLQEAELLDVRIDPGRSTVGLIFGLQGSPRLGVHTDTGVLVARRVQQTTWSVDGTDPVRAGDRSARYVMASNWSPTADGHDHLELEMLVGAALGIVAPRFEFYEVELEDGPYVIPDYTELDDAAVYAQQPGWTSRCRVRNRWQRTTEDM